MPIFRSRSTVKSDTNKQGIESSNNKSRKFRAPRVHRNDDGSYGYHPLDMMKVGEGGTRINTTGCVGDKNKSQFYMTIVDRSKAPGKLRSPRKRKKGGKGSNFFAINDYDIKTKARMLEVRNKMHTIMCVGLLTKQQLLGPENIRIFWELDKQIRVLSNHEEINGIDSFDKIIFQKVKDQCHKGQWFGQQDRIVNEIRSVFNLLKTVPWITQMWTKKTDKKKFRKKTYLANKNMKPTKRYRSV